MECDVGKMTFQLNKCSGDVQLVSSFTQMEQDLISWRINMRESPSNICSYHASQLLEKFEFFHKGDSCCDPKNIHTKKSKYRLRNIDLEFAKEVKNKLNTILVPGKLLCQKCYDDLKTDLTFCDEIQTLSQNLSASSVSNTPISSLQSSEEYTSTPLQKEVIDSVLECMNLSPVKIDDYRLDRCQKKFKRKLESININVETCLRKKLKLDQSTSGQKISVSELHQYHLLVSELQEKFNSADRSTKVQILTLFVGILQTNEITELFNASKYMVRQAMVLKKEKGILSKPDSYNVHRIEEDVLDSVISFYSSDALAHLRVLPGKKDCVSVAKNVYKQKILILCNLKELYIHYLDTYPQNKIGFSTFCSLRPKFCVLAGSSGTHSVCVCSIHQNVKLMLAAVKIKVTYKEVIKKIVCDTDSKMCMLRICNNCNDIAKIQEIIKNNLFLSESELDLDQQITFNQWTQTDRAELIAKTCKTEEFIEEASSKFNSLIPHYYIANQQSEFLKKRKSELTKDIVLVLLDFSENYTFVTQEEVQGNYWSRNSCTIHPVVIYYIDENGKLNTKSLCFISDDLKHDVAIVQVFVKHIINYVKEHFPGTKKIEYYSDGCAGQYKNCTNFLYLCLHKEIFALQAEWVFFATSHGKSPCDGVGGALKREASKESLRRSSDKQILNVHDLYEFCEKRQSNIQPILVLNTEIQQFRENIRTDAQTLPGTRGFHHFTPLSGTMIGCKNYSFEETIKQRFDLLSKTTYNWCINEYVSFLFNDDWHIGMIVNVDDDHLEAEISILQMEKKIYSNGRRTRLLSRYPSITYYAPLKLE